MSKHTVRIRWSMEDNAFIAEVPELLGCMADGPTKLTALKKVELVAKEWIATAKLIGRQLPNPLHEH